MKDGKHLIWLWIVAMGLLLAMLSDSERPRPSIPSPNAQEVRK